MYFFLRDICVIFDKYISVIPELWSAQYLCIHQQVYILVNA